MSYISAITSNNEVIVWHRDEDNKRVESRYPAPYYFYVDDPDGEFKTIFDTRVTKLTFPNAREYYNTRRQMIDSGFKLWESDISPELRVLSNKFYKQPAGRVNMTLYDIEVDYDPEIGFSSPKNPYAPINAISMYHLYSNKMVVLCVPPPSMKDVTPQELYDMCDAIVPIDKSFETHIEIFDNEQELLLYFLEEIEDTDILSGWNSDLFDMPYIGARIERVLGSVHFKRLSFTAAEPPAWKEVEVMKRVQLALELKGRMSLDYMQLYKKYEPGERHSYKLASIEEEVGLGLPKLNYPGSLHDLYHQNFAYFMRYSIRDSEILMGFEKVLGYLDVASQMYHISCGLATHVQGTLKLAELAITNFCHHELKRVVPNITRPDIDRQIGGALVLLPQIGLHKMIGSIDITSLYPSAIRSLNISPEKIIGQFTMCEEAQAAIQRGDDTELLFEYEDGTGETRTAREWKDFLLENKWAVSGYGTVFTQDTPGIIPSVLADWFATRKKYQSEMKSANNQAVELLMSYGKTRDEAEAIITSAKKATPPEDEVIRSGAEELVDDDPDDVDMFDDYEG
jgi:DNA polymerase elongation subunit (family B)